VFNSVVGIIMTAVLCIAGVALPRGADRGFFVFESTTEIQYQLGGFVVTSRESLDHEIGHGMQERTIGPYYLPLVGVTSIFGNVFCESKEEYHGLWSEAWADELGGM
jgi:hypothetical protein